LSLWLGPDNTEIAIEEADNDVFQIEFY